MNRPRLRYALAAVLSLAVTVSAIRLADRHDRHLDWTGNRRFTLDWVTRAVLTRFPGEIRVTAFRLAGADPGQTASLRLRLEAFRRASPRFEFQFVDPLAQPATASAYGIPNGGVVVLESGGARELVTDLDEAGIVSGLLRLARRGRCDVVFLTGHGERSIRDVSPDGLSGAAADLQRAGLSPREVLWMRDEALGVESMERSPDSTSASTEPLLVIAGPRRDLFPEERVRLDAHLARGGCALVLVDPRELPELEALLREWGVAVGRGVLVDPTTRLYGADATVPVVTDYARHPITSALMHGGTVPTFFPVARGVRPEPSPVRRLHAEIVASASGRAREQSSDAALPPVGPGQPGGSPPGIAIAVEVPNGARLVVIGDSDFAVNGNLALSGNAALFAGAVEWLVAGDDPLPVRPFRENPPLMLTERQFVQRVTLPSLALPFLAAVAGVAAARRGRRP